MTQDQRRSDDPRASVVREFETRHGVQPTWVARAPGRVNLIGEHTDYNDGFVLPMAIDRAFWIALRSRPDSTVALYSLDLDEERSFDLADFAPARNGWIEYVQGMAWALQEDGFALRGWEGVAAGDVPIGAGLSSSAALELAAARAFAATGDLPWSASAIARLAQRAENQWVGVNSGIMDQMISAAGKAGHALLIDCRSLDTRPVPLPPGTSVVILDTATRRELVESAYNERRASCEAAAAVLGVPALRDVGLATWEERAGELDPQVRKRARHVITENARTLHAADALERADAAAVGQLMNASHASLRDDFEVSRKELDVIVELAQAQPGCFGARMTGAGFGGCAVALVQVDAAAGIASEVAARYEAAAGLQPAVYVCTASEGASIEQLS